MWMKTIQQDLKSNNFRWMKKLTWLKIVHSGDWCLRLMLLEMKMMTATTAHVNHGGNVNVILETEIKTTGHFTGEF